jgi:predicted HD phosphohydrolase
MIIENTITIDSDRIDKLFRIMGDKSVKLYSVKNKLQTVVCADVIEKDGLSTTIVAKNIRILIDLMR